MSKVYLSLGSNQGDRLNSLLNATRQIDSYIGSVLLYSPVYESEPWGFKADTSFYNQVLLVETELNPYQVLAGILDIEKKSGRIRSGTEYTSRIIDIDILFYNQMMIEDVELKIPHPHLHLRRFVLEPLDAIAPDLIHPGIQMPVHQLLVNLEDKSTVNMVVDSDRFASLLSKNY
jgi:2-amino-4-hydroxy-6-hydroxymethyldihydropteridine diphosphokinase